MKDRQGFWFSLWLLAVFTVVLISCTTTPSAGDKDARMEWWREARFGLFIHWGLYAIPAGEWNGETNHAEWIRTTARIPLEEYNKLVDQFNPVRFDAESWVLLAREAGMKYIVITSKHHDGFCLFDSKTTDFDIMSTPFKRDIMKELADACRKHGLKICWYHSIMDWHHPDYLPRRNWETERPAEGADFDRYVAYMKNQLKELVTHYGDIGVLWFDGEWESTWNREYGFDLYKYVRGLQDDIIINNRVGAGRSGMEGLNKEGEFAGDFGTPEQQIPATGLPGVDWETCMTMNDHWGYNRNDFNWKSKEDLIQKLADIASKGGNFLLNVGPTAQGLIPGPSVGSLKAIGAWMKVNGESIYGTKASPFKNLEWGRCTQKPVPGGTRLYLHVFEWPQDGRLVLPGIYNEPGKAYMLSKEGYPEVAVEREEDALVLTLFGDAPDFCNSVIVLDIEGRPDISNPPEIQADFSIFVDELNVALNTDRENVKIRYTLDGAVPELDSPLANEAIRLTESAVVSARSFRNEMPVSGTVKKVFTKVTPMPPVEAVKAGPGLKYAYYEGDWNELPNFKRLEAKKTGIVSNFTFSPRLRDEYFGFVYEGLIEIPKYGAYAFYTDSDDGSNLYINGKLVVKNDGLHGLKEKHGVMALSGGLHRIRVTYFEKTGGDDLIVSIKGSGLEKQPIPSEMLFHE